MSKKKGLQVENNNTKKNVFNTSTEVVLLYMRPSTGPFLLSVL